MTQNESQLTKYQPKFEDYIDERIPERRWAVVYVGGKTFYLTDAEREKLLMDVKGGATIIQVGLLTLTNRFSYIYAIKDKPFKSEYELLEKNGKLVAVEK